MFLLTNNNTINTLMLIGWLMIIPIGIVCGYLAREHEPDSRAGRIKARIIKLRKIFYLK